MTAEESIRILAMSGGLAEEKVRFIWGQATAHQIQEDVELARKTEKLFLDSGEEEHARGAAMVKHQIMSQLESQARRVS